MRETHGAELVGVDPGEFARVYVAREKEEIVARRWMETQMVLVVRGPPSFGKWWFVNSMLREGPWSDAVHCAIDLRPYATLSYDDLSRLIAERAARALGKDKEFRVSRGSVADALTSFILGLLASADCGLVFVFRNVDAVQGHANNLFLLMRVWLNDPEGERLRLVATMSANPTRLYGAVNGHSPGASPFNLTPPVQLRDLTREQVGQLAGRYGHALSGDETDAIIELVGGHPGMLGTLFRRRDSFRSSAAGGRIVQDIFAEELAALETHLRQNPGQREVFLRVLRGTYSLHPDDATYRLEDAGIIQSSHDGYRPRYGLYRHLRLA